MGLYYPAFEFENMISIMMFDLFQYGLELRCSKITLEKGDTLFKIGDVTRGLFLAKSARIDFCRYGESGELIIIQHVFPDTYFALPSLFRERYQCDAICQRAGEVLMFEKADVLTVADRYPRLWEAMMQTLLTEVHSARLRIEILSIKAAKARILYALGCGMFDGNISNFSYQIGLRPETCYRTLKDLVIEGKIANPSRGSYCL